MKYAEEYQWLTAVINNQKSGKHYHVILNLQRDVLWCGHIIQNVMTLPVSTASAEWTFSSLRRLKICLRSYMTQQRLNNKLVSHCHKHEIDLTSVAKEFASANDNRKPSSGIIDVLLLFRNQMLQAVGCSSHCMQLRLFRSSHTTVYVHDLVIRVDIMVLVLLSKSLVIQ